MRALKREGGLVTPLGLREATEDCGELSNGTIGRGCDGGNAVVGEK